MLARVATIVFFSALPSIASAQETVLSVLGTDGEVIASYDLQELDALEQTTYLTQNAFIDGQAEFTGPQISVILEGSGIEIPQDGSFQIAAVNDYAVDIPYSDVVDYGIILATRMNGEEMSIREKGPLWLMYPISDFSELSDSLYSSRLVWQVNRLKLVE